MPEESGGKDFWNRAIVITGKDTNLTKAHARYLESRFIGLSLEANRATLVNGTAPSPITLPEADVSDMEYFIDQVRIVLPVLGVQIFRTATVSPKAEDLPIATESATASPLFELRIKKEGIVAFAREIDGEFTVMEGSTARLKWVGAAAHSYRDLRDKLERDGTLALSPDGPIMRFTRNHVFASPSAGSAVITGRSSNGRKEWITSKGHQTYHDWQQKKIDDALREKAV